MRNVDRLLEFLSKLEITQNTLGRFVVQVSWGYRYVSLTSNPNPLIRIIDLEHGHLIRLLLREVIPSMLGIELRVERLADEPSAHEIAGNEVGLTDGTRVADCQWPALDGLEGSPDTKEKEDRYSSVLRMTFTNVAEDRGFSARLVERT